MTPYHVYEKIHGRLLGNKPVRRHFNFEIHVTDACNLNCAGCFHFAPLADGDSVYPLAEFEKDVTRLAELFHGKFGWVHVMGGEPLLNHRINEYLDIVGRNVKKGQVDLLTNGLLLPQVDDSFFAACRRNKIRIAVTKYPIKADDDKIAELVKSKGCDYVEFADRNKPGSFSSPALAPDSKMSGKKNYLKCILANACVTLDRGKLFYCSIPTFVRMYNDKFGHAFDYENDCISIYGNDKKTILDFLRTPHDFCKYCDLKYRGRNPVKWAISKKDKGEWLKL